MKFKSYKKNRGVDASSTPAEVVEETVESTEETTEENTSEEVVKETTEHETEFEKSIGSSKKYREKKKAQRIKLIKLGQENAEKIAAEVAKDAEMVKFESNGASKYMNRAGKIHHVTRQTARILTEKGNGKIVK